jgi:hypothetical protein
MVSHIIIRDPPRGCFHSLMILSFAYRLSYMMHSFAHRLSGQLRGFKAKSEWNQQRLDGPICLKPFILQTAALCATHSRYML